MRIAHVTDFYLPRVGGIEMHVHDLARRQAAAGHDVTILTSSPDEPLAEHDPDIEVRRVTDRLRRPSALHPAAPALVVRALRESGADVVHAHAGVWSPLAFVGAWAAQARGVPTVVTCHSLLSWSSPIYRGGDLVVGWSRRRVQWTAVSDVAARPLRRLLPAGTDVQVLPNAVDPSDWQTQAAPRDPREVVVVAVMRLAARKRARQLVRTLHAVSKDLPPGVSVRAVIVGEGPQRPDLERYIARHGLEGLIELTGRRSRAEIRALYARADVFVAPATLESFGIAALEARCAGLPVVAMRQTGIRDFVQDGLEGILCADDAEMVEALRALVADPTRRDAIARHNRAHLPSFDWEHALASTHEAYARAAQIAGRSLPAQPLPATSAR
jgi:glycosyltransferase involved in cell wall biosynthesis